MLCKIFWLITKISRSHHIKPSIYIWKDKTQLKIKRSILRTYKLVSFINNGIPIRGTGQLKT